jgi:hypothetical protein
MNRRPQSAPVRSGMPRNFLTDGNRKRRGHEGVALQTLREPRGGFSPWPRPPCRCHPLGRVSSLLTHRQLFLGRRGNFRGALQLMRDVGPTAHLEPLRNPLQAHGCLLSQASGDPDLALVSFQVLFLAVEVRSCFDRPAPCPSPPRPSVAAGFYCTLPSARSTSPWMGQRRSTAVRLVGSTPAPLCSS